MVISTRKEKLPQPCTQPENLERNLVYKQFSLKTKAPDLAHKNVTVAFDIVPNIHHIYLVLYEMLETLLKCSLCPAYIMIVL